MQIMAFNFMKWTPGGWVKFGVAKVRPGVIFSKLS